MPVIADTSGQFQLGIDPGTASRAGGNIGASVFGPIPFLGFKRIADNWEVLARGNPREGYGIASDSSAGWVDPFGPLFTGGGATGTSCGGTASGLVNESPFTFTASSAEGTILLPGLVRVRKTYTFVAPNVVRINHNITNLAATPRRIRFRRLMDFDCDGLERFNEDSATFPDIGPPILAHSRAPFGGTECCNPLIPFLFPVPAAGAVYPPTSPGMLDHGIAVDVDLGTMGPGTSRSVRVYYGISQLGQNEAQLRIQMLTFGLTYLATMNWLDPTNFFGVHTTDRAAGYGVSVGCCPCPAGTAAPGCECQSCAGAGSCKPARYFTGTFSGFGDGPGSACAQFNGTHTLTFDPLFSPPVAELGCRWFKTLGGGTGVAELLSGLLESFLPVSPTLRLRDFTSGTVLTYRSAAEVLDCEAAPESPVTVAYPFLSSSGPGCGSRPASISLTNGGVSQNCCCPIRTMPTTLTMTMSSAHPPLNVGTVSLVFNGWTDALALEGRACIWSAVVGSVRFRFYCQSGGEWNLVADCLPGSGGDGIFAGIAVCTPFLLAGTLTCFGFACCPPGATASFTIVE